jgi:PKD repeat protein
MNHSRVTRTILLVVLAAALLLPGTGLLAAHPKAGTPHGRQLFSPEVTDQIHKLLQEKKLDLRHLPKVPFEIPVTRMVEKQLSQAGVRIAPHSLESICYENVYWNGGPTVASATNGAVTIWGSELGLYFAKASDPTHPVTFSFGDIPIHIYIHGTEAFVHGLWYSYLFDVSNPSNPKFVSILDLGAWAGYRTFSWSQDGSKAVAAYEDWLFGGWGGSAIVELDGVTLAYVGAAYPGGFFGGVALGDAIIPGGNGNIAIASGGVIQDPNSWSPSPPTLYIVDLTPADCYGTLNVIGTIDCSATGNAGSLLAVGDTLYVNSRPFWSYNPVINDWFYSGFGTPLPPPAEGMAADVYAVTDFADPSAYILSNTFTREGDDPVAWYAAQAGKVVLGSYQDHVLQMPAGLGAPITTVSLGDYAGSGGTQVMQDLGWDATTGKGVGSCQIRGARFFNSLSGPETGHYWTGGASQNPVLAGNYLLVPQGLAGLAILNVSNGMNPVQAGALEGTAVTMVAASADANTAYASDGSASVWAINTTDKAHPANIAGTGYTPGAAVTAIACKGTTVYVGTTRGVEVVDYSAATSPTLLASLPAVGSGGVKSLKIFKHPAYPLNTLLVTAEGDMIQLLDVSGSTNPAGYEYYSVDQLAFAPYGDNVDTGLVACNYIAANGPYLYVLDAPPEDWVNFILPTSYLRPVYAQPKPGVFPGVVKMTTEGTTPFYTSPNTPWNPTWEGWAGLENVQPGILVTGMEESSAIGILDVGTDPLAPTFAPPNTWAFPRFITNNGYATLAGFAVGNGWIWAAGGTYGIMGASIQPGWQDMEITSVDASPKYIYPGAENSTYLLKGVTTFSATIKTNDAPCRMVKLSWGPVSESWVGEIPANTTQTLTWTEDLDTIYGDASGWACGSGSGIYAQAETTDMSNCSIYVTANSADSFRTNVPPTSYYFSNVDPPIPPTDWCTGGGGINDWAVCSPITFNVLWDDCYANIDAAGQNSSGITQVALYVDAKLVSVQTNPTTDYPGPQFTIDPQVLGLTDGGHSFFTLATNAIGKRAQTSDYPFIVHFHGPTENVTAPTGSVPTGNALRVAARVTSPAGLAIQWVNFYLDVDVDDPALVPGSGLLPTTGTLLGTATSTDTFGQYSIAWDSTDTADGAHSIVAFSTDSVEGDACQYLTFSNAGAFTLVPYVAPSVTVNVTPVQGNAPLPVTFTATVTGGVAPFTYAWTFGDTGTSSTNPATHIYAAAGTYTWHLTATDSRGTAASATGTVKVFAPPVLLNVTKGSDTFKLNLTGTNFQPGCIVKINGAIAGGTQVYVSSTQLKQKGDSLKSQLPKGTAVAITVVNPDGGVSNAYSFTR